MDTDGLVRDVAYLRLEHPRLMAERHRLIAERHKIAADVLLWARHGCDLGPVYRNGAEVPQRSAAESPNSHNAQVSDYLA